MQLKTLLPLALLAAVGGSAIGQSNDQIVIRDNEVVEVKFDKSINARNTRRGDRFSATVANDRVLPSGTRLMGRVAEIQRRDRDRKAFAELEFTDIEMPNGQRISVDAYPVALDNRSVSRNRNGRLEAKKETRRDHVVIGSTVGGLILGSLIKKPFEGAVVGMLGGILVAETDALNTSGEMIVEKGQKMGAAFDREVVIDWRDGGRYDRYDEDRTDRRDDRGERRDDRNGDFDNGRNGIMVEYDDQELRFTEGNAPYRSGSTVMVPLAETAAQMGIDVVRTADRSFYLEDQDNTLKLEQNKSEARLNGKRISLPRAMEERDGVAFVPVEAFAAVKQDSLYVNGTRVSART
jgi:hypothetical protein